MAIIAKKKLVGGSYYNSTTEVSFLPEKRYAYVTKEQHIHKRLNT